MTCITGRVCNFTDNACTHGTAGMMVGASISHYRLRSKLGEGGMGVVYTAEDTRLGRLVALKFLPPDMARDPQALERFRREARAASALNHPNICTIYDLGDDDGASFIAMELLEGRTLQQRIGSQPVPAIELIDLAIQIADALDAAHQKNIIHRDIKPANIFITERGQAKVLDFGLAKVQELARAAGADSLAATGDGSLTRAGAAVGTVAYMSPEQARGEELDGRSDLFSFGCVLYEMATGRAPFPGNTGAVIFNAILSATPAAATRMNPDLAPAFDGVIAKALEKDRSLRYQSASEMRSDLRRIKRDSESAQVPISAAPATPVSQRKPRWPIAAAVAVFAVAAAVSAIVWWPRSVLVPANEWEQITDYADSVSSPSYSPDGRMITFLRGPRTFTTPGQVYAMVLPKGPTLQLTHDEQMKMGPVFSPDGSSIAYSAGFDTWTVPVSGGEARLWLPNASSLQWATDKTLLFSEMTKYPAMRITRSDASRAQPHAAYQPENPTGMAHRSYPSPDGQWVLVAAEMVLQPPWVWLPCRLVPIDGSSAGQLVGP
ncbi:MAG: protein kinase domain-containing protein, partial [Terriglobales bacterium]